LVVISGSVALRRDRRSPCPAAIPLDGATTGAPGYEMARGGHVQRPMPLSSRRSRRAFVHLRRCGWFARVLRTGTTMGKPFCRAFSISSAKASASLEDQSPGR